MLDGVRGLAVLLVLVNHAFGQEDGAWPLFVRGYAGVDLFFVLSGFLITTLLLEERERTGRISFRGFYARRTQRLLPALFLLLAGVSIAVELGLLRTGWPLPYAVAAPLLFVSNWVTVQLGSDPLSTLTATWTLSEEEQFYLLWPLALWLMTRRRVQPRRVFVVLVGAIVVLLCYAWWMPVLHPHLHLYYNPVDRAAELLAGCAISLVWRYQRVPRPLLWPASGWVLLLGLGCVLCTTGLSTHTTYLLTALIAALLMLNLLENPLGLLGRAFTFPALRYTGKVSYALYLFNSPIFVIVNRLLPNHGTLVTGLVTIALVYGAATVSWYLVESRFIRRRPRTARAGTWGGMDTPQRTSSPELSADRE